MNEAKTTPLLWSELKLSAKFLNEHKDLYQFVKVKETIQNKSSYKIKKTTLKGVIA
jgi:hypothetical protein